MDLGLKGRVALVTGASKGIGRAIAATLAEEGAEVAIASRSRENIDAAASEIGAVGFVWDSADLDGVAAVDLTLEPGDRMLPAGEVAQLVEHTTENRGVPGSIPGLAISLGARS